MNNLTRFLIENWTLKTDIIIEAFNYIDRKNFVLNDYINQAYDDKPLSIWYWQTISQPSTVAFMIELLQPNIGEKILDIWSGSWWTTALLWMIVWEWWEVRWYELISELVEFWKNNLKKINLKNVTINQSKENFTFIEWSFDKILVSAWASKIPKDLINKLKVWWIMVIPINDYIYKITKLNEKWDLDIYKYYWFTFVPLITYS